VTSPARPVHQSRKILIAVLLATIAVLATLTVLVAVPVKSVTESGATWYGGSGSWSGSGIANGTVESGARLLCPPDDAIGNSTFSFVWQSNRSISDASVVVDYGFGVPIHMLVLYHVTNSTEGGYSASVGPESILCAGLTFAGFYNAEPYSVTWTFQYFYNYTARQPLL